MACEGLCRSPPVRVTRFVLSAGHGFTGDPFHFSQFRTSLGGTRWLLTRISEFQNVLFACLLIASPQVCSGRRVREGCFFLC